MINHFCKTILIITLCLPIISQSQSLSPAQIDTLLRHHFADSNLVIIDVCTDAVYAAGHLQNAVHRDLYLSTLSSDFDKMDKSKLYVLHCISGGRSASAMATMKVKGFSRVYDIKGGITSWRNLGYPLSTDTKQSTVRFCNASEFKAKIAASNTKTTYIIDLRTDSLFARKHLYGAVNIDTNKVSLSTVMTDTTKEYFIYGNPVSKTDSSFLYAKYLAKYRNISVLKAGFDSWTKAGYLYYEKADSPTVAKTLIPYEQLFTIKQSKSAVFIIPIQERYAHYSLYSLSAILVKEGIIEGETAIAIDQLPQGLYILRIQSKTDNTSTIILK